MKTIRDFNLKRKKVIIRCDLNVPIKDGKITDDNRIKESLPTIKYAVKKGAKIILLSHLGRIKTKEDKEKKSLKLVAERLNKLLSNNVIFVPYTKGKIVEKTIDNLKEKEIVLLENTRFEDLKGEKESKNNKSLAEYWSKLGDIFINDAFATAHRKHASNFGIAQKLPSGIGLLMESELKELSKTINKVKHPYVVIMGGSKVSDKINVINNLAKKADYILIGGAMAFTFLKASGFNVGKSIVQDDQIDYCIDILKKYENKIVLPIDIVVSKAILKNVKTENRFINEMKENDIGLDIGLRTIKVFKQYISSSKTIFWNGPVGYFELEQFEKGTRALLEAVSKSQAKVIIGGGDTASAAINMGYKNKISHISTGGGASLELLEGKNLPALQVIDEKK